MESFVIKGLPGPYYYFIIIICFIIIGEKTENN